MLIKNGQLVGLIMTDYIFC